MSKMDCEQCIRAAVLEHFRWWVAYDASFHASLQTKHGVDPRLLRYLAGVYKVSRGMLKGKEADVAKSLDAKIGYWPDGLADRATFVEELAESACGELTKGRQLSAFSKYIWFLRPTGWTMYDQYAAKGLARGGERTLSFKKYYARLAEFDFVTTCENMRSVLGNSDFQYLWPERIIDKYLMQMGLQKEQRDPLLLKAFEDGWRNMIDPDFSKKLDRLAGELVDAIGDKRLFEK